MWKGQAAEPGDALDLGVGREMIPESEEWVSDGPVDSGQGAGGWAGGGNQLKIEEWEQGFERRGN